MFFAQKVLLPTGPSSQPPPLFQRDSYVAQDSFKFNVAEDDFESLTLLLLFLECWYDRPVLPCLLYAELAIQLRAP